ncbi:MAG: N-formylglutamate amidohydrolase [Oligoflexus sp.]
MKAHSRSYGLLLSCEHASNQIPVQYCHILPNDKKHLKSHRGYDPGAYTVAQAWQKISAAPLFVGEVSRLLVDLNRSLHHRHLWSKYAQLLSIEERQMILDRYYHTYRQSVEAELMKKLRQDRPVVHISVHSFTPIMNGERRSAQIGILYDPQRPGELKLARRWQKELKNDLPKLEIRRNYPYRGTADGFTVALRRKFSAKDYIGIELELRQDWVKTKSGSHLAQVFHDSLQRAIISD